MKTLVNKRMALIAAGFSLAVLTGCASNGGADRLDALEAAVSRAQSTADSASSAAQSAASDAAAAQSAASAAQDASSQAITTAQRLTESCCRK